jgi:hypothetical protein
VIDLSGLRWSRWPWDRCPARHRLGIRCDLRLGHAGPHVADRGMDKPTWVEQWAEEVP